MLYNEISWEIASENHSLDYIGMTVCMCEWECINFPFEVSWNIQNETVWNCKLIWGMARKELSVKMGITFGLNWIGLEWRKYADVWCMKCYDSRIELAQRMCIKK